MDWLSEQVLKALQYGQGLSNLPLGNVPGNPNAPAYTPNASVPYVPPTNIPGNPNAPGYNAVPPSSAAPAAGASSPAMVPPASAAGSAPATPSLLTPQPISPMTGAPQSISPLVSGGGLPALPEGGLPPAGQEGEGKGFWDILGSPSVSRGLIQAGLRMMATGAPSTDPRSGSLGYGVSEGLGGFLEGSDKADALERQKRNDQVNEAYKMAIAQAQGAGDGIKLQKYYDEQGRETMGYWDQGQGRMVQVGGSKAPTATGGSGGGAGAKPGAQLPATALKMTEEAYQRATDAEAALTRAQEIAGMMDAGQFSFDAHARAAYEVYKSTGFVLPGTNEQQLQGMDSYHRFMSQLRNVVLQAAKGTQTEGDAMRALEQFEMGKTTEARRAALNDVIAIMSRTRDAAQGSVDRIYGNYGAVPPGSQGVVAGGGGVIHYNPETEEFE